jgi:hypothetical protein
MCPVLDEISPTSDTRDRLAWPVCCGDRRLIVSIAPPSLSASFDVLAAARAKKVPASAHSVLASLAIAARQPGLVAARGFLLGARPPVLFTLTVLMADLDGPPPTADHPDAGAEVATVSLPAGRGVRIIRNHGAAGADAPLSPGALTVQYLLDTGLGALALTFTTPHCERPARAGMRSRGPTAEAFTALFDRMAGSCAVEPARTAR